MVATEPAAGDPLGEILVAQGVIDRGQLDEALALGREAGKPLGVVLVEQRVVAEEDIVSALARQAGLPYVDLVAHPPTEEAVRMLPADLARRHVLVPVELKDGMLVVAMSRPSDGTALREVISATGLEIQRAVATRRSILDVLDRAYQEGVPMQADPSPAQRSTPPPGLGAAGAPRLTADAALLREAGRAAVATARPPKPPDELDVIDLLRLVIERGASDLHLTAGAPPVIRLHGHLIRLEEYPVLEPVGLRKMIYALLTQRQRERFEESLELDLSFTIPGEARFRVNVYLQRDAVGAAFRLIPVVIRGISELGLPVQVGQFSYLPRGLVLVTGPTGNGKSTTLAALIDIVNRERDLHIVTVEDPIEFLHQHKRSIVNQREVGTDTKSFPNALRHVLRQDPDVILIGEMRDLETISTALTAAETGHLVFATLHTQDAAQTVDRVVDVFPPHQQQQVRVQLAGSLQAVVTQQLLPTIDGKGRCVATEVLVATPAIRNLIREGKTHQIYSALQAGGRYGMQTMDQSLAVLVKKRKISRDLAVDRCHNAEDLAQLLRSSP